MDYLTGGQPPENKFFNNNATTKFLSFSVITHLKELASTTYDAKDDRDEGGGIVGDPENE
jgi:hypothetical protein